MIETFTKAFAFVSGIGCGLVFVVVLFNSACEVHDRLWGKK